MIGWLKNLVTPRVPDTPDAPRAFGYKVGWLAAEASAPEAVLHAVSSFDAGLANRRVASCNWEHGIAAALRQARPAGVFFSPPLDGKVLVVEYMPLKRNKWDASHLQLVLGGVSRELGGRVCMFESHRGVSAVAWAVAEQGELLRAYAHCDGTAVLDFGLPLAQEKELSFLYMDDVLGDPDADDDLWDRLPDESTLLELAGLLSLDPSTIACSHRDHVGTGLLVY